MDKAFRRDWAQDQARKKLREMRGAGLSDVKIGARLQVSGVFIGAILREADPKPVSKKVWDNLIAKEGFTPVPPGKSGEEGQTERVSDVTNAELKAVLERIMANQERMLAHGDNQARLLSRMADHQEGMEKRLREQAQLLADLRKDPV